MFGRIYETAYMRLIGFNWKKICGDQVGYLVH